MTTDIAPYVLDILEKALDDKIKKRTSRLSGTMLATITRVDSDGTAWASFPGSSIETPISYIGTEVLAGDSVFVNLSGGMAYAIANVTSQAITQRTSENLSQALEVNQSIASSALQGAEDANKLAKGTSSYFFHDNNGAHVATQPNFYGKEGAGYSTTIGAVDDTTGILLQHDADILASFTPTTLNFYTQNSDGEQQITAAYTKDGSAFFNDGVIRALFGNLGVTFYDGEDEEDSNITAFFGSDSARIGKQSENHVDISSTGMTVAYSNTPYAFLGMSDLTYKQTFSEMKALNDGEIVWIGDAPFPTCSWPPAFEAKYYSNTDYITITNYDIMVGNPTTDEIQDYALAGSAGGYEYNSFVKDYDEKTNKVWFYPCDENLQDAISLDLENGWYILSVDIQTKGYNVKLPTGAVEVFGTAVSGVRFNTHDSGYASTILAFDRSEYGQNVYWRVGGNLVIGSGEYADNMRINDIDLCFTGNTERLYLGSDNNIILHTNANNITERKVWNFRGDGHVVLPINDLSLDPGTTANGGAILMQAEREFTHEQKTIGSLHGRTHATYGTGCELFGYNPDAGVYNVLQLYVDESGTRQVSISESAPWRNALGASSGTWPVSLGGSGQTNSTSTTTISQIITAATNVTINSASYAQWGKVASIEIYFKYNQAISVPANGNITNFNVGTLVAGKRPKIRTHVIGDGDNSGQAFGNIATTGVVGIGGFDARNAAYTIASGGQFRITATYILA